MFRAVEKEQSYSEEFCDARLFENMAILQAFFDESGIHTSAPLIAVAGAIGNVSAWRSLVPKWQAVLRKHSIRMFHATDYNTGFGEFEGMAISEKHSFLNKLFRVIDSEKLFGVGSVMELADYETVIKSFPQITLTPYQFLCYSCVVGMSKLYEQRKHASGVEVYFEAGQPYGCEEIVGLRRLVDDPEFRKLYGISIIDWISKEELVPFQVADLIVYEQIKAHTRMIVGQPEEPRFQAVKLNWIMRGNVLRFKKETIQTTLAAFAKAKS